MKMLKLITWMNIERDFRFTGFMKKTNLHKKFCRLYSFLNFRIRQNSEIYEIFLGIRNYDGKHKTSVI